MAVGGARVNNEGAEVTIRSLGMGVGHHYQMARSVSLPSSTPISWPRGEAYALEPPAGEAECLGLEGLGEGR